MTAQSILVEPIFCCRHHCIFVFRGWNAGFSGAYWVMNDWKKPSDSDTENQTALNFVRSDIALCSTLAELAKNKLNVGDKEDARKLLERAEKIYASIEQFLTHIASGRARDEIKRELDDRRVTLDGVKRSL
jgi:hypothetical protein